MKHVLPFVLLLSVPPLLFAQPDIPLDSLFKNTSLYWKVKPRPNHSLKYKPASINFGPIKTIETSAEKAKLLSKDKENGIFLKSEKSKSSREVNLTMAYEENDTIAVDIFKTFTEQTEYSTVAGTIVPVRGNRPETSTSTLSWLNEMIIRLHNDSAAWHFERTSGDSINPGDIITYAGILWCGTDTFTIKSSDNYSGQKFTKTLFTTPADGLVIYDKDIPVAAVQYLAKQAVWLSLAIDGRKKKVLLAMAAGFLAIYNSGPDQK